MLTLDTITFYCLFYALRFVVILHTIMLQTLCIYLLAFENKSLLSSSSIATLFNDDIMDAANDVLTVLPKEFFSTGIEKLEKRWLKCIRVGDYVEK